MGRRNTGKRGKTHKIGGSDGRGREKSVVHGHFATTKSKDVGGSSDSSGLTYRQPPSIAKKLLFSAIATIGFFLVLEGLLALAGVNPVLYEADPYVGFASNIPLFLEETADDGQVYMVTAPNKTKWFNSQRFPRKKPAGAYRIFSVGGSTTYGRPYQDSLSFSGWLREFLPAADPSRQWEVINAGGISYASYRMAALMEELAGYQADLFIIYTGHNEFLERRTYGRMIEAPRGLAAVGGLLSHTRIYAAGSHLLGGVHGSETASSRLPGQLSPEVDTILDHSIGPSAYSRDDAWREQVIAHFRFNLNRMIKIARAAGAGVVLVTPASNLKDCSPFKSQHVDGLAAPQRERFDKALAQALQAESDDRWDEALPLLDQAAAIDDRYAELHYRRGLALYHLGRFGEARQALLEAREQDVCPLRAVKEITQIVEETARRENLPLVDFASVIAAKSGHGIPGASYFNDHVHLTYQGYRLLALQLINTLARTGAAQLSSAWSERAIEDVSKRVEARIDRRQQGIALRNLAKVFNWAGKTEESGRLAAQAAELLGGDAESFALLGLRQAESGKTADAIRLYKQALDLEPGFAEAHFNLGAALMSQGRLDAAIQHYREALRLKPGYAVARGGLGEALLSQGNVGEAVEQFRQAVRLDPHYAEPHIGLGRALADTGRTAEAIEQFRAALAADPRSANAHNNLGIALARQGDHVQALDQFREALRLDPGLAEAYTNAGSSLATQGKLPEAVEYFEAALHANPHAPGAHRNLAVALATEGKVDAAMRHVRGALDVNPDDPEAHFISGNLFAMAGKPRRALEEFQSAARHRPAWPEPLARAAWILATAPDPRVRSAEQAIELAERAAKLTKNPSPAVLDTLSAAYAEARQFEKAIASAEQAVSLLPPADPTAAEIRQRLKLYAERKPYRDLPPGG